MTSRSVSRRAVVLVAAAALLGGSLAAASADPAPPATAHAVPAAPAQRNNAEEHPWDAAPAPTLLDAIGQVRALFVREELLSAAEMLDRLLQLPDATPSERVQLIELRAEVAERLGRRDQALFWLQALAEQLPQGPARARVLLRLGRMYRECGAFSRATDAFYRVVGATVQGTSAQAGDLAELEALTRAAAWEVAETTYVGLDFTRSHELFARFCNQYPDTPVLAATAWLRQGDCLLQLGRWEEASAAYQRGLEVEPAPFFLPEVLLRLAVCQQRLERPRERNAALAAFMQEADRAGAEASAYWQRRLAWVLASFYRGEPARERQLLEGLQSLQLSAEWRPVLQHLEHRVSTVGLPLSAPPPPASAAASAAAPAGDDSTLSWIDWDRSFSSQQNDLRKRISALGSAPTRTTAPPGT